MDRPDDDIWKKRASRLLRAELKLRGMSYADLARRVNELGGHETVASISNKVSRGAFSFAFFLMCQEALPQEQAHAYEHGKRRAAV